MASNFMSPFSILLAFVLLLQQGVFASGNAVTQQLCVTHRTSPSPSGPIPTKTRSATVDILQNVFITKTPAVTMTPSQVTQTATITVTASSESDVPQSTDTFTATSTVTETESTTLPTQTITSTSTTTTTTTTSASGTTTVPTPAGFTPILQTLPDSAQRKRRSLNPKAKARAVSKKSSFLPTCPAPGSKAPSSWPAAVTCLKLVESFIPVTFTKTASKTTTVTVATPTTTVSTTTTTTTTIVVTTPDASSTIMQTETDTTTSTISPSPTTAFTTTTVTVTAATYTATAYAQCATDSNNFAGTLDGYGIVAQSETDGQNALGAATTNDNTQQACCNSCAANPLCVSSTFYGGFPPGSQCYNILTSASTCSPGEYSIGAYYESGYPADGAYIISNGNCGLNNADLGEY